MRITDMITTMGAAGVCLMFSGCADEGTSENLLTSGSGVESVTAGSETSDSADSGASGSSTNADDGDDGDDGPKLDVSMDTDDGADTGADDGGDGDCDGVEPPTPTAQLTGTVYSPNLEIPIAGALVYLTTTDPEPVPDGVYCAECVSLPCDAHYT